MSSYNKFSDVIRSIYLTTRSGERFSLEKIFIEINIFEDIMSSTLNGFVQLSDSNNILDKLDIYAYETIEIVFYTGSLDDDIKEHTFFVYKVDEVIPINEHTVSYRLYFTTQETITNTKTLICKRYSGLVSDFIMPILQNLNTTKPLDIEESGFIVDYIVPSISPFKAIEILSKQAINNQTNNASFVFYETIDGYNFKSIETLVSQESVIEYSKYSVLSADINDDDYHDKVFKTIEKMSSGNRSNITDNINKGVYSSKYISHDILNKSYKYVDFNRDNITTLEGNKTIPDSEMFSFDYPVGVITTHNKRTDVSSEIKSPQSRMSVLKGLTQSPLQIQISGNSKLKVGLVITFNYPSFSVDYDKEKQLDKYLSGKRLIVAIRHTITQDSYIQVLDVAKDSLLEELV